MVSVSPLSGLLGTLSPRLVAGASSSTVKVAFSATGASSTGVTVKLILCVALLPRSSVTLTVKLSVPL